MLRIEFKTDNAAFEDAPGAECARILRDIADRLDRDATEGVVTDINGNAIGCWAVEHEEG